MNIDENMNHNTLKNDSFQLVIASLPHVMMFTQEIEIPGFSLGASIQATPLVDIPRPSDKLDFETFTVTFMVDEDLKNYMEIDAWMRGLGFPQHSDEFKDLVIENNYGKVSDIKVKLLTNKKNFNMEFTLIDAWPTSLSSVTLNYDAEQPIHPIAVVEFQYTLHYYGNGHGGFFNK